MSSVPVLFMVMMMAIYGGVDVMECLEMYEEEPEVTGREIGTLCNLNPTLDICAENVLDRRRSSYRTSGRIYPVITDAEPHLTGKRKSAYMRFGKRYADSSYVKRKSAYMRFGR